MSDKAVLRTIRVNDRAVAVGPGETLAGVLRGLGLDERKGAAAAVNGAVVPRVQWPARALADGDQVLVIRAAQGG